MPLTATVCVLSGGVEIMAVREVRPDYAAGGISVPSHDLGSSRSGLAGVGREAIGERDDEVAQFIGALDDERPVE